MTLLAGMSVGLSLLAGGCGSSTPAWGGEAEAWVAAAGELAGTQGALGLVPFFSEDVVLDVRSLEGRDAVFTGRHQVIAGYLQDVLPAGSDRWHVQSPLFVDASGAGLLSTFDSEEAQGTPSVDHLAFIFDDIGPGAIEHAIYLMDSGDWRARRRSASVADGAEAVAGRWAGVWSEDEGRLPYIHDAEVTDSLVGVDLRGPDAIGNWRQMSPQVAWTVDTRSGGGLAVHPYSQDPDDANAPLDGVAFVAFGDDGQGCPGRQLIWLTVGDTGLIETERRFWALDDARRCFVTGDEPAGWWTDRVVPEPATAPYEDLETVTSTFTLTGQTTEIRNGTPTLLSLVQWALARFDRAGMGLPIVEWITFSRYSNYCTELDGLALPLDDDPTMAWALVMCMSEDEVCRTRDCNEYNVAEKRALLHELGHVWMEQQLSEATREAFVEFRGLASWNGHSVDWESAAAEHGAEFIAWGLLDDGYPMVELGLPPVDERREGFQLLTGRQPLQPWPD